MQWNIKGGMASSEQGIEGVPPLSLSGCLCKVVAPMSLVPDISKSTPIVLVSHTVQEILSHDDVTTLLVKFN